MSAPILMISNNPEDCKLGKVLALNNAVQYLESVNPSEIQRILKAQPGVVVWLDYDAFANHIEIIDSVTKYAKPSLCFLITSAPLPSHPQLTNLPFFRNHIQRRFSEPAPIFYSKIVGASIQNKLDGLRPFFTPDVKINRIELKQSGHKKMAIEALQKTLTNRGIQGRLATLMAQCVDELILNAIFDAPIALPEKNRFRHPLSRDKEFEMKGQEVVTVEMATANPYLAICVIDQYGSLDSKGVFRALRSHLSETPTEPDPFFGPSSGFGLNGILQAGLNLRIACQPGKRTETCLFLPTVSSYREFKTSFRYFSVVTD
jgi:hypothetical protein